MQKLLQKYTPKIMNNVRQVINVVVENQMESFVIIPVTGHLSFQFHGQNTKVQEKNQQL